MKLTCLFDSVCSPFIPLLLFLSFYSSPLLLLFRWTNIFRDFAPSMVLVYTLHNKGKRFTIVDPSVRHFESKIRALKSLYSPKHAACRTDAVLRKYGDTSAR